MSKTTMRFYTVAVLAIVALFGNALLRSIAVETRREAVRTEGFETLSNRECVERYNALVQVLAGRPASWSEYYTTLHRADMLVGAAQKAMKHSLQAFGTPEWRDTDIVRSIPVDIRPWMHQYQRYGDALDRTSDWRRAYDAYEAAGYDPLRQPSVSVLGGDQLAFWWMMFYFGTIPFVGIHYAIQIRNRRMRIWLEVCSNPAFPLWLFFWPIGLFRYPMKTNPAAQLRRARQWAMLVLSSALSCFAGTGKVCEKRQQAPQHQHDDRPIAKWSFSTATMSQYLGLDGAVFFSGVNQQSTVTAKFRDGLYASFTDIEPVTLRSLRPTYGREMDFTGGWSGACTGYSLDFNATYLNVFPLARVFRGDVLQLSEKISHPFRFGNNGQFIPYVWLRQAVPVRGPTPIGGWFVHGGTTFSQQFGRKISGSVGAEVVHDSGAFGFNPGYVSRITTSLTFQRGRHVSFQFPLVTVTAPLSRTNDGRRPQASFGFSISFGQ